MEGSTSGRLQIWEGWAPGATGPQQALDCLQGPHRPQHFAERLACHEMLRGPGRGLEGVEPLSLQWFLDIERYRHGRYAPWLPRLLELSRHAGEVVLGLGGGLGTDWAQLASHGAEVVVGCPSTDHLGLIRRNFEVRGLRAALLHADPSALPLDAGTIDVACVLGVIQEAASPEAVVEEVYRVLKPGGKVVAVVPAHFDIDFWRRCFRMGRSHGPQPVSFFPAAAIPPRHFTGRRLGQLFARFQEPRLYKRLLRRAEVPHLWRWLPLPLLERVMGRLLIFKAFKPLSAARAERAAA